MFLQYSSDPDVSANLASTSVNLPGLHLLLGYNLHLLLLPDLRRGLLPNKARSGILVLSCPSWDRRRLHLDLRRSHRLEVHRRSLLGRRCRWPSRSHHPSLHCRNRHPRRCRLQSHLGLLDLRLGSRDLVRLGLHLDCHPSCRHLGRRRSLRLGCLPSYRLLGLHQSRHCFHPMVHFVHRRHHHSRRRSRHLGRHHNHRGHHHGLRLHRGLRHIRLLDHRHNLHGLRRRLGSYHSC